MLARPRRTRRTNPLANNDLRVLHSTKKIGGKQIVLRSSDNYCRGPYRYYPYGLPDSARKSFLDGNEPQRDSSGFGSSDTGLLLSRNTLYNY